LNTSNIIDGAALLGFNTNVKHNGRMFHLQTEDSGSQHRHVITQLFVDGGRVVKSERCNYSEHLAPAERVRLVRALMIEQHKRLFITLRSGQLDTQLGVSAAPTSKPEAGKERAPLYAATRPVRLFSPSS
jgi:hypothetical protein